MIIDSAYTEGLKYYHNEEKLTQTACPQNIRDQSHTINNHFACETMMNQSKEEEKEQIKGTICNLP